MKDGIRRFLARSFSFFYPAQLDRELDDEMAEHLTMATEENVRNGMSPEEARRNALIRFGGIQQAREGHRESRGLPVLDELLQDLRYTLRTLKKDRSFTIIAVLILALGIGANIAVFSVINTLLLKPLAFPNSQQLVWFTANHGEGGLSAVTYNVSSYEEFRRHNQSFQEVTSYQAFWGSSEFNMTWKGEPQHVQAVMVADNFFKTLGVQPELGRSFLLSECQKDAAPTVMLTHAFWMEHFAGDRAIVGQTINLSKQAATVIGVLPSTFDFASVFSPGLHADVFTPAYMDELRTWGNTVAIIGRLKSGVTVAQAQAEADVLMPQFRAAHPEWYSSYTADLSALKDYVSGKLRRSLFVLWAAVALNLLIVCVNLANLLLARMASRGKEFAMRSALGASRGRLIRQLVTESLVLSAAGAVLGVALAFAVSTYLAHQGSIILPLLSSIRIDGTVLIWTLLIDACGRSFVWISAGDGAFRR